MQLSLQVSDVDFSSWYYLCAKWDSVCICTVILRPQVEARPREVSSASNGTAVRMPLFLTGETGNELKSPPRGFAAGTLLMSVF